MTKRPRDYQLAMHEAVREAFRHGNRRVITELFTGAGKTVCFSLMAKMAREKGGRVLIVVNRDVLITQALNELEACGVHAQREQANERASILADVVVGSIQSMQGKWLKKWHPNYFRLVILDEMHGSAAKTFRNVLDHFGDAYHVGVTATAERHDRKSVWPKYEGIVFRMPLTKWIDKETGEEIPGGQDQGWIVPFQFHDMECPVTLDEKLMHHATFSEEEEVFDSRKYLPRLARETADKAQGAKGLFFLPNCRVSNGFAQLLREHGINAQHIDSSYMKPKETARLLEWFANTKEGVLTNSDLLATGYNQPDINLIGMFRPIASTPNYKQRLGRGTRAIADVDAYFTAEERIAAIANSAKPVCRVLNVFWENGDHDLAAPSCLITDDPEERKKLTDSGRGMIPPTLDEMRDSLRAMRDTEEEKRKFAEKVANSQEKKVRGKYSEQPFIYDILKRYPSSGDPITIGQLKYLGMLGCPPAISKNLTKIQGVHVINRYKKHKERMARA